jgi:hypothetical protein
MWLTSTDGMARAQRAAPTLMRSMVHPNGASGKIRGYVVLLIAVLFLPAAIDYRMIILPVKLLI